MQFISRLVCFSLLILIPGIGTTARADLIAHWTANGTPNDSSGNGHHGTLINGTGYGAGAIGQAFLFDGVNDYFTAPGDLALQPSTISVAMWINAAPASGLRLVADSSHGGSGGVNQAGWALQLNAADQLDFVYGNGSVFPSVVSTTAVADDTFHHLVAILNGTSMQIYVDGSLDATATYSGTPSPSTANSGNIQLGNHYQFSRPLDGLLDDIRIYNHALSQSEISALASVPEPSSLAMLAIAAIGFATVRRRYVG